MAFEKITQVEFRKTRQTLVLTSTATEHALQANLTIGAVFAALCEMINDDVLGDFLTPTRKIGVEAVQEIVRRRAAHRAKRDAALVDLDKMRSDLQGCVRYSRIFTPEMQGVQNCLEESLKQAERINLSQMILREIASNVAVHCAKVQKAALGATIEHVFQELRLAHANRGTQKAMKSRLEDVFRKDGLSKVLVMADLVRQIAEADYSPLDINERVGRWLQTGEVPERPRPTTRSRFEGPRRVSEKTIPHLGGSSRRRCEKLVEPPAPTIETLCGVTFTPRGFNPLKGLVGFVANAADNGRDVLLDKSQSLDGLNYDTTYDCEIVHRAGNGVTYVRILGHARERQTA